MLMRWVLLLPLLYGGLAGCTVFESAPPPTPTATVVATPTQLSNQTPLPTAEPTPDQPDTLTLWLPDILFPASGTDNANLINQQIADFAETRNDLSIEVRRRRVGEPGGIMSTLRAARDVAPGAMPDLTLLRRESLTNAVQQDLVQPLEGIIPTSIVGDLFSPALELGQVSGTMYGLPYALNMQHMIYPERVGWSGTPSFDAYLTSDINYLFPAARTNALNDTFLLQYLAAGGDISADNTLTVDEDVLLTLFTFYQTAAEQGTLSVDVLDYNSHTDYQALIAEGEFGAALVTVNLYFELVENGGTYAVSALPTQSGQSTTILNGWMWVMNTSDPAQQEHVAAFLNWMLDPARQGEYVRSLGLLPSQQAAFDNQYDPNYAAFSTMLLNRSRLPLTEVANSSAARAMQSALVAVIAGELTAQEATDTVIDQVTD